jgi:hypothetical protein
VDVDYKALSNAGSWFVGKLQTDQDKQRLLDGLQGAAPAIDRAEYDRLRFAYKWLFSEEFVPATASIAQP